MKNTENTEKWNFDPVELHLHGIAWCLVAKWCQVVSIYVTIWPRDVLGESLSCKNAYIVIEDWCDLKKWGWC